MQKWNSLKLLISEIFPCRHWKNDEQFHIASWHPTSTRCWNDASTIQHVRLSIRICHLGSDFDICCCGFHNGYNYHWKSFSDCSNFQWIHIAVRSKLVCCITGCGWFDAGNTCHAFQPVSRSCRILAFWRVLVPSKLNLKLYFQIQVYFNRILGGQV